jgi:serine/threonine protein kinase
LRGHRTGLQPALADRYRIERELGRGEMATVYLAEDLKHGRRVALKVLRPELIPFASCTISRHGRRRAMSPRWISRRSDWVWVTRMPP